LTIIKKRAIEMKKVEYRDALTVNLSESQRRVIEDLAAQAGGFLERSHAILD